MRKLFAMVIIGLGLMVGFGFEVYACDDCVIETEEDVVMTYEEVMQFECYVWNELYIKSCVNYCEECDCYYYAECMCNACYSDCEDCLEYDYQLFIEDNYDMIMDIYEDIMNQLEEYRIAKEREETVIEIYEF